MTTEDPDGGPETGGETTDRGDSAVSQFDVPEMDCPSCAGKVESSVETLEGVETIDPQIATGTLTVTYDADATDSAAIAERIRSAGYDVAEPTETLRLSVPDMDCASCAGKVESALSTVEGLESLETQPTTGTVVVTRTGAEPTDDALVAAIERAGYDVEDATGTTDASSDDELWTSPRALKTWASGVVLAVGLVLEFLVPGTNAQVGTVLGSALHVADLLFLVAVAVGGQAILRNGYYSARNLNLDIDLLMSIAILGALTASLAFGEALYFEAATLAVLFSIAELLERYSMDRARDSLEELMDLSPEEATVRRGDREVTVPVDTVDVGERVVVRPGEKIPLDGHVIDGESAVNQAPITGESVPVDKTVGDEVYAGTINEEGYLEVQVTSASGDNTLSRIVEMVEDAQSNKTEREQFVERFSAYYTPVVVALRRWARSTSSLSTRPERSRRANSPSPTSSR